MHMSGLRAPSSAKPSVPPPLGSSPWTFPDSQCPRMPQRRYRLALAFRMRYSSGGSLIVVYPMALLKSHISEPICSGSCAVCNPSGIRSMMLAE